MAELVFETILHVFFLPSKVNNPRSVFHVPYQAFNNRWAKERAKNSVPGRRQREKLDIATFKQQERFTEVWDEGEFFTVDQYLTREGFKLEEFESMSSKLEFLTVSLLN